MKLKQDDVVGIAGGNTTYLLPVIFGCLLNCTPFHVISPHYDEDTIKHLFCITRPKLIFCDGNIYDKINQVSKILKAPVYTLKYHKGHLPKVEDLLEPTKAEYHYQPESLKLGGDQTIAIVCTSGTTGTPKGVCLSNSSCLFDFGSIANRDVMLSFSTVDWAPGLYNMLFTAAHGATRIITDQPFSPKYLVELVEKYQVTILALTAPQITHLVKSSVLDKQKLRTIRCLTIIGNNCYVPNLVKLQEYLSTHFISYGYTLSECGGVAANVGLGKAESVGRLVPGVKVKILDEAGRSLGHGETGEITINNGRIWNGYYGNPNESQRLHDYQGWFHTGDLGYFDNENFLYVAERKKDILKFHGMEYRPQDIERVVAELPDVLEVCVFGLWNDVDGDAAAAAVVKVPKSKLSEQDIVEYVAKRLVVTHKQLHCGVFFVPELPRTSSGKVLRSESRDLALGKKWQVSTNGTNK